MVISKFNYAYSTNLWIKNSSVKSTKMTAKNWVSWIFGHGGSDLSEIGRYISQGENSVIYAEVSNRADKL